MKVTFRWYGKDDPVTLPYIRQIPGMSGIVSAVYSVPPGEVWPEEQIAELKKDAEANGLEFEVVESIPVHEDIKLGEPTRDKYIENYIENIRRLGRAGVKVVCYNFMPVFDWTRSQLDKPLDDGSTALVYYKDQVAKMDPLKGELSLPGWDSSYKKDELEALLNKYSKIDEGKLWENLEYFLKKVIPAAEESGIKMAIHPDDPPWSIFGLPRIITCEENVDRFLSLYDSESNGITLCTGSLGCKCSNDMVHLADKYSKMNRIPFLHFRNVLILPDGSFEESAHLTSKGSLDMFGILEVLHKNNWQGYVRPDHGRMIWGEKGRPGYGLFDRALGATYINGIWEALDRTQK